MSSVLDLPIERQKEIARLMGFGDDLLAWQKQIKQELEQADAFGKSVKTVSLREFLDNYPIEEQYQKACYCSRVFLDNMPVLDVLKEAGYDDSYIQKVMVYS